MKFAFRPIHGHRLQLVNTFGYLILFLLYLLGNIATADYSKQNLPDINVHGLADFRMQYWDAHPGQFENGQGKFRFGGDGIRVRANEAALSLQSRLGWDWSGTVTVKYADRQYLPIDLTEAFLSYRPVSISSWNFGMRLGMFFPPIALENTGTAWSSPYTLNSSAINSWVGEELRTFGGEAQLSYQIVTGHRIKLFAAGLANNDTAGALLAWRGWSLHDFEAPLNERIHLPNIAGIQANLPEQAVFSQPYVEVDGRPGYYAGFSIEQPSTYAFRALYYDNRGKPSALVNGQYAWHTSFWSLGLKADLPWDLLFISQGISGRTRMGDERNGQFAVDSHFWAASALVSKVLDKHRFSIRYDRFGTNENDYLPQDQNRENGYAWTANYNFTLAQQHQINIEVNHINSNRPRRLSLRQNPTQEETLWQIAYRFFF